MKKLLIAEVKDFSLEVLHTLKRTFIVDFKDIVKEDLKQAFLDYDIFWFRIGFKLDKELLALKNNRVKIIVCPATGLDHIDTKLCEELNITVLSLKGEFEFLKNVRATAEHTIGLALCLIRNTLPAANSVKDGIWNRDLFKGSELFEKKVAVIGYGRLGRITAGIYAAFGANVFIFDREEIENPPYKVAEKIDDALHNCFLCSLHISYSDENIGFFDDKMFDLMPLGSYFVNTSRGSLVNERALIENVETGKLLGVATDVVENEPHLAQSELWMYANKNPQKNILITPHIGGNTHESFYKTELFMANKLISHEY